MRKTERFGLTMTAYEKGALKSLATAERLSEAAVVRRLIWREAQRLGLLPDSAATVGDGEGNDATHT